jgi:curli biogenesis system outer membrane secretion channel CsgG
MGKRARIVATILLLGIVSIGVSALPDLVVSSINFEPSHPQAGQSVFIEVTVSNHGPDDVENPFFVRFFVDDREIAIQSIVGGIDAGDSKRVATEWIAHAGLHSLSVEVDPPIGRIDEANEKNNIETRILTVPLTAEAEAAIGLLKVVVAPFEDLTGSGFLHVGEGVSDKLIERFMGIGVHVLDRSELEAIMQDRALNPSLTSDVATAGRLLGADIVIAGSVMDLEVRDSSFHLGFVAVNSAVVDVCISAHLVNVYTTEIMGFVPAEGHAEGTTGFSVDLTGFLSLLQSNSPDICGGGLQTVRSWYNVGESIPFAYRNPGAPEWFSLEITTGIGSFVRWLGWQHIDTDDCSVWNWDQLDVAGFQMSPGVYSAKLWNGTAYIAEVSFQIRPGISLSIPPVTEITVGTREFDETVVGGAFDFAMDDLVAGLLVTLQDVSPILAEQRASPQFGESMIQIREGQIASVLPDGRIAINIGASVGVAQGEFFEVLDAANVIVDPQSLEILDYDILGVKGQIIITEVRDRVSYGAPTSDFEPIIGDIVRWLAP